MAALTLTTLIRLTRELVGDLGIDSNSWTDEQVVEAINFALVEVARKTGVTYTEATATAVSGGYTVADEWIRVIRVLMDGVVLHPSDLEFEDLRNSNWRASTVTATRWGYVSGNVFTPFGIVSGTITAGVILTPTLFDSTTVSASAIPDVKILDYYHPHLKYAAASYLLQTDGDTQDLGKSEKMLTEFNSLVGMGPELVAVKGVEE